MSVGIVLPPTGARLAERIDQLAGLHSGDRYRNPGRPSHNCPAEWLPEQVPRVRRPRGRVMSAPTRSTFLLAIAAHPEHRRHQRGQRGGGDVARDRTILFKPGK